MALARPVARVGERGDGSVSWWQGTGLDLLWLAVAIVAAIVLKMPPLDR